MVDNEWGAAALGAAAVGVIGAVARFIELRLRAKGGYLQVTNAEERKNREQEDELERRNDSAMVKEYRALVASLKQERLEDRELVHDLRNQMQRLSAELAVCRAGRARADERIAALEDALSEAGIPHRKWNPETGDAPSHEHPALPPAPKSGVVRRSPPPESQGDES